MCQGVEENNPGVGNRLDAAGAERTRYFALQTAHAPTLSAAHHIISPLDTTSTDMPSTTQLNEGSASAPCDQGDRAHACQAGRTVEPAATAVALHPARVSALPVTRQSRHSASSAVLVRAATSASCAQRLRGHLHSLRGSVQPALAAPCAAPTHRYVANLASVFPDWNGAVQGYLTIVHAHAGVASGNSVWIDSAANYHLGKDRSWFFNYRVLLTPEPITGIAGSASVIGVGDIAFLAKLSGGQTSRVVFTNVLHAPGIVANLLSVSRLDKNGLRTTFCDGVARMELKTDGTLHSQGRLNESNLYSFDGTVVIPSQQPPVALGSVRTSTASLQTWHRRFSHLNPRAIQKLASQGEVDGLSISGSGPCVCTPCQVGKAHRLPFPASSQRAPTRLHRCYGDILDVGTPSIGGARYLLLLGDDHTRKLWGFPLGRKSDAFEAIRGWLLQVQTFTGLKVKQFGTDGGGEFLNKDVDALLRENGTERFVTPAYTSQRNSRSERPNLTTVEAIITVLEESGLPTKFWAEIALAHLVTKNLSPHAGIGGSVPDALWDPSRRPSVAHLRPIGCKGTMTILSKQDRKIDFSFNDARAVGPCSHGRGKEGERKGGGGY